MAPKVPLDVETLQHVFEARKDILKDIKQAADTPDLIVLFNNIATFVYNQLQVSQDEPASKRRRVDVATISQANGHASASKGSNGAAAPVAGSQNAASGIDAAATEQVLLEIKDISVSAPQRKKYDLCFTKNFLYARASGTTVPVQGIVYPWGDIEHAFYLPVPEKSQVQHNYVLFPRNSYLPTAKQATSQADESSPLEPLVFTIPATAPKPGSISGSSAASASPFSDSYTTLFNWALSTHLSSAGNPCRIVSSDPKLFHSVARQPFRSSEKAVHVKGFRGSKDGYLFFLPTGILWGFKKPLLFLPLDRIVALSYTSVLQRTFNIVVEYEGYAVKGEQPATEEIEFAMLDQEDYASIDQSYVRKHGLADGSMAEQRKAKRELAENSKKGKGDEGEGGEGGEAGVGDDNGMTELEKAQLEAEQALQDEEDEEEEDYDPGSEGESEGSGSSDDDDDDDDDGDGEDDEDEDGEGDTEMAG